MLNVSLFQNETVCEMRIPLQIKVHPVVREFIVSTTGSDVIEPLPNTNFYKRIQFILQLRPKDYNESYLKRRFRRDATITILVGQSNISPRKLNPLYRNHLDDYRQNQISRELYKGFKDIFHNYVFAYMRGGGKQQKHGIQDFCSVYNLTLDRITYEMLKKSWDRSDEKKILKEIPYTSRPLKKISL